MEEEIWKDIVECPGFSISNFGNVKSVLRNGKELLLKPRLIGPKENNKYYDIEYKRNNIRKHYKVHRLVAFYFVENPRNLTVVNHIDGNNKNNHFSNLEWVTISENVTHGYLNKKKTSKYLGVSWCKEQSKWLTQVRENNKPKKLGRFFTEEEAYQARLAYDKKNNIINKYQ